MKQKSAGIKKSTKNTKSQQFKVIAIPKFGDCLYAAIALAVFGSHADNITSVVQKVAVEYICDHWENYNQAVTVHNTPDVQSYRNMMSRPGIYGDNPEVAALSKVYGVCVKVLVGDDFLTHNDCIFDQEKASSGIIHLHYDPVGLHYNLLEPNTIRDDNASAANGTSGNPEAAAGTSGNQQIDPNMKKGDWIAVQYDNSWYPGDVISTSKDEVEVKCMEHVRSDTELAVKWPRHGDIMWYLKEDIICTTDPPFPSSNRALSLKQADYEKNVAFFKTDSHLHRTCCQMAKT